MDFSKICRSCNSEKTNLLNLFANDFDDEPTLGEKFLICTTLDLQEADEYPQNICYSCAKQLETAYKFRKQCERSFNQLQQKLNGTKKQLPRKVIKVENVVDTTPENDSNFINDNDENLDVPARIRKSNSNQLEPTHLPDSIRMPTSIKAEAETIQVDNYESDNEDVAMTAFDSNVEILDQPKTATDVSITANDRRYQCIHCDKNFFTSKGFDLHLKLTHKIKQPSKDLKTENSSLTIVKLPLNSLVCSACNIEMASIDDLRMHRIIEHNEQFMKCNICGVQIRTRIAYKKHLLTHYKNKPYDCQVCGKQYTEYRYLYRHMLYHKTSHFKCKEARCGKTFIVKHKYIEHLRMFHYKQLTSDQVRNIQPVEDE